MAIRTQGPHAWNQTISGPKAGTTLAKRFPFYVKALVLVPQGHHCMDATPSEQLRQASEWSIINMYMPRYCLCILVPLRPAHRFHWLRKNRILLSAWRQCAYVPYLLHRRVVYCLLGFLTIISDEALSLPPYYSIHSILASVSCGPMRSLLVSFPWPRVSMRIVSPCPEHALYSVLVPGNPPLRNVPPRTTGIHDIVQFLRPTSGTQDIWTRLVYVHGTGHQLIASEYSYHAGQPSPANTLCVRPTVLTAHTHHHPGRRHEGERDSVQRASALFWTPAPVVQCIAPADGQTGLQEYQNT